MAPTTTNATRISRLAHSGSPKYAAGGTSTGGAPARRREGAPRAEGRVRVAGRVGAGQLRPRRAFPPRVVDGHPHEGRAVAPAPGRVDGRLVPGDKPLVGVHPLGEHAADLPRVTELARDEAL